MVSLDENQDNAWNPKAPTPLALPIQSSLPSLSPLFSSPLIFKISCLHPKQKESQDLTLPNHGLHRSLYDCKSFQGILLSFNLSFNSVIYMMGF
jgi:hypothetical protein